MLKLGEANPLAVFGLRRVEHCPPHFTPVDFDIYVNEKIISDWIYENLSGRFYYGYSYNHIPNPASKIRVNAQRRAAFELPSEASYFSLLLDTINRY